MVKESSARVRRQPVPEGTPPRPARRRTPPPENPEVFTIPEAARFCRIGQTVFKAKILKAPGFPLVRLPGSKRLVVPREALMSWLTAQAAQAD